MAGARRSDSFSFTQWGVGQPFDAPVASSYGPQPFFRDQSDADRSGYRRTPEAQYPDGYLGTLEGDRLDNFLANRPANRQCTRGVHKGERINPQDYVWPEWFNDQSGIARQMVSDERFVPIGTVNDRLIGAGRLPIPRGAATLIANTDPSRAEQLAHLGPPWS